MTNNKDCCSSHHLAFYFSMQVGKYKFVLIRLEVTADLKMNITVFWATTLQSEVIVSGERTYCLRLHDINYQSWKSG
jgi:hypothetical protein